MDPREKLIVALDVPTAAAARKLVAAVGNSVTTYKVGLQLYTAEGPQVVRDLISVGRKVFLDLKYHDIPNTVASAVREAAGLGVTMITVHALGGGKMLRAAVEAARTENPDVKVLAVTVLTSMDEPGLTRLGVPGGVMETVIRLAALAIAEGCHGVVASAQEAPALRRRYGQDFVIVTPGVRPAGAGHGDQARVVTPSEAMTAGATHIVVGRPIIEAADPGQAAKDILAEMS
ncbi:MAG TPA: orotidine-5'-phosphate decarboxylase [Terriglobales bacterium]|jgi:orotidine-5'-phosphate decarboxylase|nr:orotidine-5'-phosphate decarboxylase [Terriglobales bacterium]